MGRVLATWQRLLYLVWKYRDDYFVRDWLFSDLAKLYIWADFIEYLKYYYVVFALSNVSMHSSLCHVAQRLALLTRNSILTFGQSRKKLISLDSITVRFCLAHSVFRYQSY